MEVSWKRGNFPERDVEVFHIRGAFFSEECLIFDDELQVVENASDPHTDEEIERALANIKRLLEAQRLPHFVGPGVVSKRRAASNYGHFLMEMLPMAIAGRAGLDCRKPTFLLHRVPPKMLDVVLRSARLLDIDLDDVQILDYSEPVHFEELIVVRGLTAHGTYMSPLCVAAVSRLTDKVQVGNRKRLFVTRGHGLPRGRALRNQDAIGDRLRVHGFEPIDTASMTFEEQISAFGGAEHVVGVAGAAMSNIAFCRPGTQVVNLAPPDFSDTFFWFIATHRGLQYSEIRGEKDGEQGFDPNANFWLRETDIKWLETRDAQADQPKSTIIVYVHNVGDVQLRLGEWSGTPGSGRCIEGFSISLPNASPAIRYRGILGRNWLSPWVAEGDFCGTRGFELPLFGLVVDWADRAPYAGKLLCDATFIDGSRRENVPAGEPCVADSLAPLEAFRLVRQAGD